MPQTEDSSDDDFLEAVLVWKTGADSGDMGAWFERRGFIATPMQAGLLLGASIDVFNQVFECDVRSLPRPALLRVPPELRAHVKSIEIPRPRHYT